MDFKTAVSTALHKYATFSGRARRSEYWWFVLFQTLISIVATVIDAGVFGTEWDSTGPASVVTTLALLLPSLAVTVRRLHDCGRSGWWFLIVLIPLVGAIVLLVCTLKDSVADNQYGPSPKYSTPAFGYGTPAAPGHAP